MKYLILLMLVMFSCNVNATTESEVRNFIHKKFQEVKKMSDRTKNFHINQCLEYIDRTLGFVGDCIITIFILEDYLYKTDSLNEPGMSQVRKKIFLDMITIEKHSCNTIKKYVHKDEYYKHLYNNVCQLLEADKRRYEQTKNECMKKDFNHDRLLCLTYKFE